MAELDAIARQLSAATQKIRVFEQRYGTHALLRERQHLFRAFTPLQEIQRMLRVQNVLRSAFKNPFEEMMRSIRPSLSDIRLRSGMDPNVIRSINTVSESLSRPSDTLQQLCKIDFPRHSSIGHLIESQSALARLGSEIRNSPAGSDLPSRFPHERTAEALAGIEVLSAQNKAMRQSSKAALETIKAFQSFAQRQLHRARTDNPDIFYRRIAITDMAGDFLETAQCSWELLGQHAVDTADDQSPDAKKPTIYSYLNQELSFLYREDVQSDPSAAFERSTASTVNILGGEIVDLIYNINENRMASGCTHIVKPTNRTMRAVHQLTASVCTDEQSFGEVVDALYFLVYEGSGNAKRLTELMTNAELTTVWWIKALRTSIRHDIDHGVKRKSKKKHVEIGEVYKALVGYRRPRCRSDWSAAQVSLMECTANLFRALFDTVEPN